MIDSGLWFMGWSKDFASRANSCDLTIGVIGLGYVGLPTAIGFHDAGFIVWGVDISQQTVNTILKGDNPTGDSDLNDIIPVPFSKGWNITTSTEEAVRNCDVLIVTVPTPVTDDLKPDLSYVESAGRSIFSAISKGSRTVVILESTVYPGVTAQTWLPEIENAGLEIGVDVEIAYCPERFNPGDSEHGVKTVARVIGCANQEVGESLIPLYSKLTSKNVSFVGDIEIAEASKVIENVQRDINIALINELARIFPVLGIDIEDVLSAAATKWNFHRYTPGVGVGGHCIPVDPYYLIQRAADVGVPTELITAARAVNRTMPIHVAGVLNEILYQAGVKAGEGRVLLLGWSYKPEVGDPRETPAEPLFEALKSKNVKVASWDPHLVKSDFPSGVEVIENIDSAKGFDLVVLTTAHKACLELDFEKLASRMRNAIFYDGRRVMDLNSLQTMGWQTHAVGRP